LDNYNKLKKKRKEKGTRVGRKPSFTLQKMASKNSSRKEKETKKDGDTSKRNIGDLICVQKEGKELFFVHDLGAQIYWEEDANRTVLERFRGARDLKKGTKRNDLKEEIKNSWTKNRWKSRRRKLLKRPNA